MSEILSMEDKKSINVKDSIDFLKQAIDEISSLTITDSDLAKVKQEQLRDAIYPVMKATIQTSLWTDEKVIKLLLDATNLEDELARKHTEHIENGN